MEAGEHLSALSSGLIALEQEPQTEKQAELIETIFREAHSLKGAARAVNLVEIETFCQPLESVFSDVKRGNITLSPGLFDLLHKAIDALGKLLLSIEAQRTPAEKSLIAQLAQDLEGAAKGTLPLPKGKELKETEEESSAAPGPEALPLPMERVLQADTVRIATAKLDSLLLQAEELLSAKLTARQRAAELRDVNATIGVWKKEWAKIHPDLRNLQQSLERNGKRNGQEKQNQQVRNLAEFLEWNHSFIKSLESTLESLTKWAEQDHRSLGGMVDNLLGDMKKVCMLPFASLLEVFPKRLS